jgi:hypothetical protein
MSGTFNAHILPVTLVLNDRAGITLWATPWSSPGEDSWQGFLGAGDKVFMFPSASVLSDFVASGEPSDLSDHPAWRSLTGRSADELRAAPIDVFDLDCVYALVGTAPDPVRVETLAKIVYIAAAIAECCDDHELTQLLSESSAFVELAGSRRYFDRAGARRWDELSEQFLSSWDWVCARIGDHLSWRDGASDTGDLVVPQAPVRPWHASITETHAADRSAAIASPPAVRAAPSARVIPAGIVLAAIGVAYLAAYYFAGESFPIMRDLGAANLAIAALLLAVAALLLVVGLVQTLTRPSASSTRFTSDRLNTMAVVAFVLTFVCVLGGIICGHLALADIRRTGERGRGLAIAALVLSYGVIAVGIGLFILGFSLGLSG